MDLKVITFAILLALVVLEVSSQDTPPSCRFEVLDNPRHFEYRCFLTLVNTNGIDTFSSIGGQHQPTKTNLNVNTLRPQRVQSPNIPRVLCDKFTRVTIFDLSGSQIQAIGPYSLRGCISVSSLNLANNRITKVSPLAFENNRSVRQLRLDGNKLESLPNGVFRPLTILATLDLSGNPLRVIRTGYFGVHMNLANVFMNNCKINALSPVLFEQTGVRTLQFDNNECARGRFTGTTLTVQKAVQACIDNYRQL